MIGSDHLVHYDDPASPEISGLIVHWIVMVLPARERLQVVFLIDDTLIARKDGTAGPVPFGNAVVIDWRVDDER